MHDGHDDGGGAAVGELPEFLGDLTQDHRPGADLLEMTGILAFRRKLVLGLQRRDPRLFARDPQSGERVVELLVDRPLAVIGRAVLPPGLRERLEAADEGAQTELEELAALLAR